MIRAVLDTNILVSALLWGGLPARILSAAYDERFIMLFTDALMDELQTTLSREKFAQRIAQRQLSVPSIIRQYRMAGQMVNAAVVPDDIVRDPKDRHILACAQGGNANYIVSGDNDLLVLGTYAGIPIFTPRDFLQLLGM